MRPRPRRTRRPARSMLPAWLAALAFVAGTPAGVLPARAAERPSATPIMGRNILVADQMAAWYASTGRRPRLQGVTVAALARLFVEEGAKEGVRGDVAFAQAIFETDYFAFSERVPPQTNNFAGIGAPSHTVSFPSARIGVRAQIQHLRAYADPAVGRTGTATPLVDPRFTLIRPTGQVATFEELGGRWSTGADYGQKVVNLYRRMVVFAGPSLRGSVLGAPMVSLGEGVGGGYWLLDRAGGVFALGGAPYFGSVPGKRASGFRIGFADAVDLAPTPTRLGYWVVDADGGVHAFGDARFFGSIPGRRAAGFRVGPARAAAIAATPAGGGYWILDQRGGVHAFGDARFLGSIPGRRALGDEIGPVRAVDLVPTATGGGYSILDETGGIHAFGDAGFFGSIPGRRARGARIGPLRTVGLAMTPTGKGYWILDHVGGIHAFGDARFLGTLADDVVDARVVELTPTSTGYRVTTADGGVFSYAPRSG